MLEAKPCQEVGGICDALEALRNCVGELGDRVAMLRQRLIPFLTSRRTADTEEVVHSREDCSPLATCVFHQVERLNACIAMLDDIIHCMDLTEEGVAQLMSWDKQADNS